MNQHRIEINLLLPSVTDAADSCVGRLAESLEAKAGIDLAHAIKSDNDKPDRICIHYDPRLVSTGDPAGRDSRKTHPD